jgi:D-amino-acid dehydrogenase
LVAYRSTEALNDNHFELELLERMGVAIETVSAAQLRERAPGLSQEYRCGILFPDSGHVVDPLAFAKSLFGRFVALGGQFRQVRVERFRERAERIDAAVTTEGDIGADIFVCSAGIWSRELCRSLGIRVPLEAERGYHVTLPRPGIELETPLILGDAKFAVTPMAMGLRLAGTIEFGGTKAPALPGRFEALLNNAARAFPGLDTNGGSRWMGFRPSLPDSLPVIGRSPRHDNAFFAFGHGHLGLTSAGITGKAIADLAAGRPPDFDLSPFRIDRFGWW